MSRVQELQTRPGKFYVMINAIINLGAVGRIPHRVVGFDCECGADKYISYIGEEMFVAKFNTTQEEN